MSRKTPLRLPRKKCSSRKRSWATWEKNFTKSSGRGSRPSRCPRVESPGQATGALSLGLGFVDIVQGFAHGFLAALGLQTLQRVLCLFRKLLVQRRQLLLGKVFGCGKRVM